MSESELILLQRWRDTRDADAFKTLALRHTAMVFNTCRRILGNHADAEEVTQDCLVDLALTAVPPKTHVAGWLHRVATYKAINRVRIQHRRKQRNHRYAEENARNVTVDWDDLCQYLDEALAQLPDKHRSPLVMSFFEDQSHEAIARALGLTRGTVTYRIKKGIEALRKQLKRRGVPVTTASLLGMLAIPAANAAATPPAVANGIARLALAGMKGQAAATAATTTAIAKAATLWGGILAMKKAIVAAAIIVAAVSTGVVLHTQEAPPATSAQSQQENGGELATTALSTAPVPPPETSPEQPPLPASSPAKESTDDPKYLTVDGAWSVLANKYAQRSTECDRATFTTSGSRLRILAQIRNTRSLKKATEAMDGTIRGLSVDLDPAPELGRPALQGLFNEELTRLVFRERRPPSAPTTLVFVRVPREQITEEETLEKRKQEARQMFDLLASFAQAHGGMVPKTIEELVAAYPDAAELFAKRKGRRIEYFPANATIQAEPGRYLGCPKNPPERLAPLEDLAANGSIPDQLAAKEAQLQKYWGDHPLFREPTFRITAKNPDSVVTARFGQDEAVVGAEEDLTDQELREQCGNNLKYLALIVKVFNSEYDDYDPGGWHSALPEQLAHFPEPCTLTCPGANPGTDSYEILLPASHADAYYDIASQVLDVPLDQSKTHANVIPFIYENHEHPGNRSGRMVTFYDGHAEFLSPEEFKHRVAPFLEYRYE